MESLIGNASMARNMVPVYRFTGSEDIAEENVLRKWVFQNQR